MDDGDLVDTDLRDEIVRLEARIEELAGVIESCRKIIAASRGAILVGAVLLIAIMLGAIALNPTMMIAAIAAVIGGIVLLGSNSRTSDDAAAALQTAEARRTKLIGAIDLQLVAGRERWLTARGGLDRLH
jgi:hypothetical protein